MRTFFRILLVLLVLLVVGALSFYFWGSSTRLKTADYHREVSYAGNEAEPKDTLSIMTYNIGYLSGMTNNLAVRPTAEFYADNLTKAKAFIDEIDADIVGFQEIDYGSHRSYYQQQLDEMAEAGDYAYGVQSVNWDRQYVPFPYWPASVHFKRMLSGQAILSKYPVENSARVVLEKPINAPFYYNAFYLDRLIQVARINVGRPIVVLNVHLEAFDVETREAQAEILLDIYQQYAEKYPVLLMGDFNARPPFASEFAKDEEGNSIEERTTAIFFEAGLEDAIAEVAYMENEAANFTFNTEAPYEKLDYIFYDPEVFTPINGRVVTEAGQLSDHLPVLMEFVFNRN